MMIRHYFLPLLFATGAYCDFGNNASVIIVGAGASGIAAAMKLLENNFTNVKILEAEDRIGGRIHSLKFGDNYVDMGAEFCHGEKNNVVFSMASKYHMLSSHKPEYVLYYSADGQEVNIDVHDALFSLAHCIVHRKQFNASEDDSCMGIISEGQCLKRLFDNLVSSAKKGQQSLLKLSYTWLKSYKSATESSLNLDDVCLISDYEECEGDQMLSWRGLGFKTVLDLLMKKFSNHSNNVSRPDKSIFLQTKVTRIVNWTNGSKIEITSENGEHYLADHVIFTPSLGVLKADHASIFSPPIPNEKISAIEKLGYGVIVKVALYFENPWWIFHGQRMWGCIWSADHALELTKQNLTWIRHFTAFTAAPENPKVLIAWFAGEGCPHIETLSDFDVFRGVRFILSKCFVTYEGIDMPKKMIRSKWLSNPNFRGTYSYDSIKGEKGLRGNLGGSILNENDVPSLLFAGEATHPTWFATVHGAIETGYREAERLIKFYKDRT